MKSFSFSFLLALFLLLINHQILARTNNCLLPNRNTTACWNQGSLAEELLCISRQTSLYELTQCITPPQRGNAFTAYDFCRRLAPGEKDLDDYPGDGYQCVHLRDVITIRLEDAACYNCYGSGQIRACPVGSDTDYLACVCQILGGITSKMSCLSSCFGLGPVTNCQAYDPYLSLEKKAQTPPDISPAEITVSDPIKAVAPDDDPTLYDDSPAYDDTYSYSADSGDFAPSAEDYEDVDGYLYFDQYLPPESPYYQTYFERCYIDYFDAIVFQCVYIPFTNHETANYTPKGPPQYAVYATRAYSSSTLASGTPGATVAVGLTAANNATQPTTTQASVAAATGPPESAATTTDSVTTGDAATQDSSTTGSAATQSSSTMGSAATQSSSATSGGVHAVSPLTLNLVPLFGLIFAVALL